MNRQLPIVPMKLLKQCNVQVSETADGRIEILQNRDGSQYTVIITPSLAENTARSILAVAAILSRSERK